MCFKCGRLVHGEMGSISTGFITLQSKGENPSLARGSVLIILLEGDFFYHNLELNKKNLERVIRSLIRGNRKGVSNTKSTPVPAGDTENVVGSERRETEGENRGISKFVYEGAGFEEEMGDSNERILISIRREPGS